MLSEKQANKIAEDWIEAGNNRDIDQILSHYEMEINASEKITRVVTNYSPVQ